MNKTVRILQFIWLGVAIVSMVLGTHAIITKGSEEAIYFFVITLVSAMMYFLNKRRYQNIINEKKNK